MDVSYNCLNSIKMKVTNWNDLVVIPLYPLQRLNYKGFIVVKAISTGKRYTIKSSLLSNL